ncbi:MAG: HAMP domain-containing protein [Synechococcaceae cyanobacterium SM2_3_1]|nr:HAMP domain-containing protein [Synechococcaceae cyanobacterium SM2_3_1]
MANTENMKKTANDKNTPSSGSSLVAPSNSLFISLRVKLLIGFTLIFSAVFAAAFYWFYSFTTQRAIQKVRDELNATLQGAAEGINVSELLALYEEGEPNQEAFSDDPRYESQLEWFEVVQSVEPRAWPYTYLLAENLDQVRRQVELPDGEIGVEISPPTEEYEIIALVDLWSIHNPDKSYGFLESDSPSEYSVQAWESGNLVERPGLYSDSFGSWMSSYTALKDNSGDVVALLGVDIQSDYVLSLQQAIRDRVLLSFGVTYSVLFVLVYILSGVFTQPLNRLKKMAERIGEGDYEQDLSRSSNSTVSDEITTLAQVFDIMVTKVKSREENLKGKIEELKILIDEDKRHKQVQEIVESDFFQDLQSKAKSMRDKTSWKADLARDEEDSQDN